MFSVEDGDVVLAAHRHPHLAAVLGEEGLVRRAADVGRVLDRLVAVSMKVTEFDAIDTTASVLRSGEKPSPWTRTWPL